MANNKHNMYGTPTYKSWCEMKYRCSHNIKKYKDISYCERWECFENFYADMGIRPNNTTLDRINPFANYELDNCRWANIEIQENNKTNTKKYLVDNEYLSLNQIARKYNISRSNLANKVYLYKWDINKAIKYLLDKKVMTYR